MYGNGSTRILNRAQPNPWRPILNHLPPPMHLNNLKFEGRLEPELPLDLTIKNLIRVKHINDLRDPNANFTMNHPGQQLKNYDPINVYFDDNEKYTHTSIKSFHQTPMEVIDLTGPEKFDYHRLGCYDYTAMNQVGVFVKVMKNDYFCCPI